MVEFPSFVTSTEGGVTGAADAVPVDTDREPATLEAELFKIAAVSGIDALSAWSAVSEKLGCTAS
jgi:hypothetical protein